MKFIPKIISIICNLAAITSFGIIIYQVTKKTYKIKLQKLILLCLVFLFIGFITSKMDESIKYQEEQSKLAQDKEERQKELEKEERNKTLEDKKNIIKSVLESGKTYEEMSIEEKRDANTVFSYWDELDQEFKDKYQSKKELLEKSKDNETEKLKLDESKKKEEKLREVEVEKAKQVEENKASYDTGITYEQLARTPEDYKGKKAKFGGKVVQVVEGNGETSLRIAIDGNYDKILYVVYDPKISKIRILEKDNVIVRGISQGIYTYDSIFGEKITVPLLIVDQIDLN